MWIPLSDGARLSALLWLPVDAEARPGPAILEYLPYRHHDGTLERDLLTHPYLAGHGYACLRVDLRGAGDSDGVLRDEYLPQEQDDALEVIAWMAKQPWCTGAVGMMGISWGGFNALQVAARRPPALRAIVTVCSTDDRYADDTHYPGGSWLSGNLGWGGVFFALLSRPPDPVVVGERWRGMWQERLEALAPPVLTWLAHQRRDAYWRHGSVREDYRAITCPALVVGGWADGYTNAVGRLLTSLGGPRQGLIGPWAHAYPHLARPRPIDFLGELVRWWEQWLKGVDTGILAEPMLRAWIEEVGPPDPRFVDRPGRWVAEPTWPSSSIQRQAWSLGAGTLTRDPAAPAVLEHRSPEPVGLAGGVWCPYGFDGELPADQREDDGASLCFDSPPLPERLTLLGTPELTLDLSVNRASALVCARLCAVGPDGASTRLSYGLLNLSRRQGFDRTAPIAPGHRYRVTLPLNDVGCTIAAGHRLRLALSTSYWPMVWPSPDSPRLTVYTGSGSALPLPVRSPRPEDDRLVPFGSTEPASPGRVEALRPPHRRTTVERDLATETFTIVNAKDRGRLHFPEHGLTVDAHGTERLTIRRGAPLSARCDTSWTTVHERGDWRARTETRMTLTGDVEAFRLVAEAEAYVGDHLIYRRDWDERIPRDGL